MIGQLLDRRYRIIKVLGANAFGKVYLAADTHRPGYPQCVVKQLKPPSTQARTLQVIHALLKKKAEMLEKLAKHERIPQLLAFFEDNNEFYLVEEYISGQSLASEMMPGVCMSEEQVIRLLQEVLEILEFVHQQGAIHGHVKPTNIIRRQSDGKLVLIDFGRIKEIGYQAINAQAPVSQEGAPITSSAYRAPEQIRGNLLPSSDLYGLGAIAIQALTGLTAEELPTLNDGDKQINWRDKAKVSAELADLIDKMVSTDLSNRYQSATEVLADLKKIQESRIESSASKVNWQNSITETKTFWRERLSQLRLNWLVWAGVVATLAVAGLTFSLHEQIQYRVGNLKSNGAEVIGNNNEEQEESETRRGAAQDLKIALQLKPNNAEMYYQRGNAKYDMGDYRGALEDYTEAIRLSPDYINAYYNRGLAFYALKEYREAIKDFGQVIRLNPEDGEAYRKRARAFVELGDYQGALADLTRVIQLNPNDAKAYIERGNSRWAIEDSQGAIADYTQAIRIQPERSEAFVNRGKVKLAMGNYQSALEDYSEAIRINPAGAEAYSNRCQAYLNLGEYKKAIEDCTAAIGRNRNDAMAYSNRCFAAFNLREYNKAIEDCTAAIGLDPNNSKAYRNRGLARAAAGDLSGAIDDFSSAIRTDPSDAGAYSNRAAAYSELGDLGAAIEDYTRAIRIKPEHDGAYYGRGLIRAQLGDKNGAVEDLQKASKLCLDRGNTACYNDAQTQVRKLQGQ